MNRKIAIPAVVLGLGLGVAALSPNIASAETIVIERPNPVTVVPTNPSSSLTVEVDSVDVASGTARISGTVAETPVGFINANGVVASSWGVGHGLADHRWTGTVRGLVAGDNTVSIEQYSKATENTPRELWKQIADTTTLTIHVGEGTEAGFTAAGLRHDDGSITVSGSAAPNQRLSIVDARYDTEYAFAQADADGRYTAEIPAGYFTGATILVEADGSQRGIPVSQLTR